MKFYSDIHLRQTDIYVTPNAIADADELYSNDNNPDSTCLLSLKNVMPIAGGALISKLNNTDDKYYTKDSSFKVTIFLDAFTDIGRYVQTSGSNEFILSQLKNNNQSTSTLFTFLNTNNYYIELIIKDLEGKLKNNSTAREQILKIIGHNTSTNTADTSCTFKRIINYTNGNWTYENAWRLIHDLYEITYSDATYTCLPSMPYTKHTGGSNFVLETPAIESGSNITAAAFYARSDKRKKTNIIPLKKINIIDLPLYTFDYINGPTNQIGCLAQELQQLCPQLVQEDSDGYLTIQENKLVYLLLQELRELKQQVIELEKKNGSILLQTQ